MLSSNGAGHQIIRLLILLCIILNTYSFTSTYFVFRKNSEKESRLRKGSPTNPPSTDSGYDTASVSTTITRGHSSAHEFRPLKHATSTLSLPVSKVSNGAQRHGVPGCKQTALDSAAVCLEQINNMNLLSLQVTEPIV